MNEIVVTISMAIIGGLVGGIIAPIISYHYHEYQKNTVMYQ